MTDHPGLSMGNALLIVLITISSLATTGYLLIT